jgi:hypothetical protein
VRPISCQCLLTTQAITRDGKLVNNVQKNQLLMRTWI